MSTARLSNQGYLLLSKQTVLGTPVAPAIGVPLYDETINTNGNFQDITPAYGTKFATYATLPGIRSHKGDITCLFEANTAAHLFNAELTKGTTTGSDPYTHPFTLTGQSAFYTYDIGIGNMVKRFWDVQASKITPNFNNNEIQAKVSFSALGSFDGREIASISGSGPYTIVLADPNGVYDGNPTKGLLPGDAIRFYDIGTSASVCDTTVTAVTNGTTFTVTTLVSGSMTSVGAGDVVHLRPVAPTLNNMQPFLWSKARFYFAANAATALGLATTAHTPVEVGSTFDISHSFSADDGAPTSGSHDPTRLDRTTGDISLTIKKLCDTPEDVIAFKNMNKSACVIRMFAGATNQYECRVTFNQLVMDDPIGNLKSGEIVYATEKYHTNYNQTDAQAFDVKVLNALATV